MTDYFSDENNTATFNAYTVQRIYQMAQTAGDSSISLDYDSIVEGLGYVPADASSNQYQSFIKNITVDSSQADITEMYYDISTAINTDVCSFHHYYLINQQPIVK